MSAFYLAFLAVLLAGLGGRDQVTVATLSLVQRGRPGVLLTGIAVTAVTAALAAWAASFVLPLLMPRGRLVLTGIALALAAGESLWPFAARRPEEPTASLGALALVLLAHQLVDAARFLIFALGVAGPIPAGIGGAVAGALSLGAAWALPDALADPRLRRARRIVGAVLLLAALMVGFQAITR